MSFKRNQKRIAQKPKLFGRDTYKKLEQPKRSVIKKILYLFTFYTAKASRISFEDMQQKYYIQLYQNVFTEAGKNTNDQYDKNIHSNYLRTILYSKGKKTLLNFSQFLDLLPAISVYLFHEDSLDEAIKKLINYMISVYEKQVLLKLKGKVIEIQFMINKDIKDHISCLSRDLLKVYKIYFPHQIHHVAPQNSYQQQSFNCLTKFLQQFEVFPKFICCRDLFYIYNEAQNNYWNHLYDSQLNIGNYGKEFTFQIFINSLVFISQVCYNKLKQVQNQQQYQDNLKQKLKTLLEYMEMMKGIKRKYLICEKQRFSFILLQNYNESQINYMSMRKNNINQALITKSFFSVFNKLDL